MNEVLMETVVTQPADNGAKEYIYGVWDRFNSYHSEFDISDTYGRTVGIQGQILAILERPKEAGATEKFVSEALKLTQKVVDLCHPLSLKTGKRPLFPKDSPSGKRDFIVSFEPIESQFQHLISWEIGFGPPLLPDGPFVGLEKDVQLLTSRLIAGEAARQVVFIVGQRRTGKTTLAQMVYNNAFIQTHFDCHAWVTVSWNFSSTSALLNIASQVIPYELLREVRSLEDLFILLRDFLGGRKYLIVLDHSSIIEDWNILVKLLPLNEFNGSRIISTTRISGKEYDVPNSFILEMRRLSDEEGWELLKAKVGFKMTGELENLGRAIVKKSRGLPGQLLLMGSWLPYKPATQEQAYIRAFWRIFQFYTGFRCQKERDSLVGTLGQLVAILELREKVGATENFAIEAFGLTQNIFDIWDRGSFKMEDNELEPSDLIALGLIENQIKDLFQREIGFASPPMGDGQGQLLVGLEEEVQLVTSRLMVDKAARGVVSIVGREGIGKTTLAQMVYDSDVVRKHFCYHAWVTVPQNLDPRSVLLKIAVQVLPLERLQKAELVEELAKFLIDKTCLIVLDDVQTPEDWNILEKLLRTEINQIVITTHCRDIIHDGADYFVLEKRALSDEEAWELLNARVRFSIPASLEQLGRGMVMKCMGLPSAICKVGDELSKKEPTQDQWYMVLQQINQDQLSMYGSLDMAADELPLNFKQCLLYLGHFHEDYEVPVRRLIAYWVAEGLLQKIIDVNEPPEFVAEKLLMVLVQKNLIMVAKWKLNGKAKTCRMNHHLRDNWLSKAKEANSHPVKRKGATSKSSSGTGMILQLADHLNKEDECFPHIHGNSTRSSSSLKKIYRELCFFVSFDFREGPLPGEEIGSFFHKCIVVGCFKKLRVVDLEGVFRPKLPDSIGKLTQLRYLGLRWTYLQMLPSSIGKLLNLQTLDLKRTYISSLSASLWKLQQLRHLYLSEFFRCSFVPPPKNSMLMDLQTLWGAYVNEETPIKDGLDRLTNLRKLGLAFRLTLSEQKALADWITKLNNLESLRLVSLDHEATQASNICLGPLSDLKKLLSIYFFGRLENPIIVHSLPRSLTEITLSRSGLREDPMRKLGKLPDLRILRLYAGSYCGKNVVCCSGGFPLLRILKFWELEELEEWTVEEGTLKILREVEIRSCKKLEMLPDGLKHLHHCRELIITNMPKEFQARIIESQGQDWQKIAHVPSVIVKD